MKILQRYFAVSIAQAVAFVLAAFLALQAFMDLTGELPSVGKNGYGIQHAFLYVLIMLPNRVYEVMPVAALIGTIYTMAQFASTSEFTIMRASSMSTRMAAWMLFRIGVVLVVITFIFGELIAPRTTPIAEKIRLSAQGAAVSGEFRSGLWTKDIVKSNGMTGTPAGSRFFNVREVRPDGQLLGVRGERPENVSYPGVAGPLQQVWIALRANERAVLEQVSLADIVSGNLPDMVRTLTENPSAWV